MSFTISTKKESTCKKHKFCIYHHHLSMEDLDKYIIEIMFDENNLNQLFQPFSSFDSEDRIFQLKRFIDNTFINRENEVLDTEIETVIKNNTNKSYYSFFAEALLARLSIDYIDNKLITAVISVDDNIEAVGTGG